MLNQIQALWRQLVEEKPGKRFKNLHEKMHTRETSPCLRWTLPILGFVIAVAGLIMIPAPGPGTIILFFGLGMIATECRPLAHWLDGIEVMARAVRREFLSWWRQSSHWSKAGFEALITIILAATGYVGYHIFLGS
jgi:uncharacterized protein (TIGR02611 family)